MRFPSFIQSLCAAVLALATTLSFSEPTEFTPRTLRVSFYEYKNCHDLAPDGSKSGIGYDFFELLSEKTGWKIEYVGYDLSWTETLDALKRGDIDVVDFIAWTKEREAVFGFSKRAIAFSGSSVRTSPERLDQFPPGRYGMWGKVRVGTWDGDQNEDCFRNFAKDNDIDYEITRFPTERDAAEAVKRGDIDLAVLDGLADPCGLLIVEEFAPTRNLLGVREADAKLLREIDEAMAILDQEEPGWMTRLRAKYYPPRELVAYVPGSTDRDTTRFEYMRAIIHRIGEVARWKISVKPCKRDCSDVDTSVPFLLAGLPYSESMARQYHIPLLNAGRRRTDVFSRPDDTRFADGLHAQSTPYRVGYATDERYPFDLFKSYAADHGIPYNSCPYETPDALDAALASGEIDFLVGPSAPSFSFRSVASCGYVDLYIGCQKDDFRTEHELDEALKYLKLDEPQLFLELEERYFGTGGDDDHLVRLAAYVEGGLSERRPDGSIEGFVIDYVDAVARRCGWNVETLLMSYPEAQRALANGTVDLMGAAIKTPEREAVYDYSKFDIGPLNYAIMKRSDGRMLENRPDTWAGACIGLMRGSKASLDLEAYLSALDVAWTPVYYASLREAESALRSGSLDAVYTLFNSQNRDLVPLVMLPTKLCYFCSNKEKPWIKAELDTAVEEMLRENNGFVRDLSAKHLSADREVLTLTADEIAYVQSLKGRKISVGFSDEIAPLAMVDKSTGEVSGFYPRLFDRIAKRSGLSFEFRKPGEEADLMILFGGTLENPPDKVIANDWIHAPACWVRRRGDDGLAKGVIAVRKARPSEVEYIRRSGQEPLLLDSRDECYLAVLEGRAEKLLDSMAVARQKLDNERRFRNLNIQRVDASAFHRRVGLASSTAADPRLRAILNKSRDSIPTGELDALLYESIYGQRLPSVRVETVLWTTGIILFATFLTIYIIRRRAMIELRHANQLAEAERHGRETETRMRQREQAAAETIARQRNELYAKSRELERTLLKAEEASRAKTVFLNNMSHDIRTPMNAITGFSAMARKFIDDKAKVADCLEKIDVSGRHLLELINEVLDMSRIESGRITIEHTRTDVVAQLQSLEVICGETAADKGVRLSIDPSGIRHRFAMVDAMHVNQVLLNIVGNAIKYTRSGGSVSVKGSEESSARAGAGRYVFTVADTGVGMSEEFLKHVFEPFSREETSTVSGIEGTGLGMSIVRKIVDLCGGTIDIQSVLGKGTTVILSFDFDIASEADETPVENEEDRPLQLAGSRVLLVEDNAMNREIARYMLESNGVAVDEAVNGALAVERLKAVGEEYYGWVLMDIQMPVMNGYDAARAIRAWEKERNADGIPRHRIHIIAMTANAFEEDKRLALEAGMDAHLAKPVNLAEILRVFRRFTPPSKGN